MIRQRPTITKTGAYTTTDADNGCRIICNSASAFEVTLHTATGRYNFDLEIDNIGAGTVTVSGQTIAQYGHSHIGCDGTSWIVTASGGGSGGAVDSVNGETGAVILDAADIDIADSGSHFTATDVEGALTELFTSGSDGKAALETAIETKGGTVDKAGAVATFAELEDGVDSIPTGSGTYQAKTVTPDAAGQTVTPDTGYDALSSVTINGDADLTAGNIKKDIVVFGVTGTYEGSGGESLIDYFDKLIPMNSLSISYSYIVS